MLEDVLVALFSSILSSSSLGVGKARVTFGSGGGGDVGHDGGRGVGVGDGAVG